MKASIIIPSFNRLWCLPQAIESCPDDPDIEIIVVDDGSTDGTWEWLATQAGRTGLRAVRQQNCGKPRAVNLGVEMAAGDYIKFLDSDDLCLAENFDSQVELCLREQPDICPASYIELFQKDGRQVIHEWVDIGDFIAQQLGECDSSHYSAYVFRRDFIKAIPHRPEFSYCDDRMLLLECALRQPRIIDFSDCTLIHRHHDRGRIQFGTGSVAIAANLQKRQMYQKVVNILEHRGELTERRRLAPARDIYALAQRTAGYNWSEAREILAFLFRLNPGYRPSNIGRNRLYRMLGFVPAQVIVNALRAIRDSTSWLRMR